MNLRIQLARLPAAEPLEHYTHHRKARIACAPLSLPGLRHRVEQLYQARRRNSALFDSDIAHSSSGLVGFLDQCGRALITDFRSQSRSHGQILFDESPGALTVGLQIRDASAGEVVCRGREQFQGLQKIEEGSTVQGAIFRFQNLQTLFRSLTTGSKNKPMDV